MLTTERLRSLVAVHRNGSVSAAAQALHITPSGMSQQLGKLERETGHRLLTRQGRGIRLTEAGLVLVEHAERVLDQLTAAEADLADLHTEILGPLRIGSLGSVMSHLLAPALAALHERHPRLEPSLVDGEPVDTVPALLAGDLDLVLAESWSNRPSTIPAGIDRATILSEPVQLALSNRHPLANREVVDLAELADTAWTSCDPGTGCYESLVQALRGSGVEPRVTCAATEYPTQLALVAANLVAALVPPLGSRDVPDGVTIVEVRPALHREIYAAWRADADRPAIRACLHALRETVAGRGGV